MGKRRWSAWLLAGLMLVAAAVPAGATPTGGGPADHVQVFIGFDETPGPAAHALVARHGGSVTHSYTLVPAVAASVPRQSLDGLARNPQVTYVEPVIEAFAVDHSSELDAAWGVKRIGSGEAHHDGFTGSKVRVAVLDSGIDLTHPDLAGNIDQACSWGTSYGTLNDGSSHGTHVAGTVAALRNGAGVVGVGPDVALCVFKVLGDSGSGSFSDIVAALNWIGTFNRDNPTNPIRVTNNSYGASTDPGTTVRNAFANLEGDVLHIAAAGNSGNPRGNGSNCIYPAIYPSVVAVAATDSSDRRASFSSTCDEVELSAPGVSINSTIPGGKYGTKSGTSMASPHVAGAAALVFAAGETKASAVRTILTDEASALSGGSSRIGAGLVQAYAAALAVGTPPPAADTGTITGQVTDSVTLAAISGATVFVDGTTLSAETDLNGGYTITDVPAGTTYEVTASADGYISAMQISPQVVEGEEVTVNFALEGEPVFEEPEPDPDEPADITLTITPYKVRGLQKADLIWSGANTAEVAILFNGGFHAWATGGSHTHHIDDRGGGSYTYQVCESTDKVVDSESCSAVVTVEF